MIAKLVTAPLFTLVTTPRKNAIQVVMTTRPTANALPPSRYTATVAIWCQDAIFLRTVAAPLVSNATQLPRNAMFPNALISPPLANAPQPGRCTAFAIAVASAIWYQNVPPRRVVHAPLILAVLATTVKPRVCQAALVMGNA